MTRSHHTAHVESAPTQRVWSPPDAFRYCKRLASSHYENFPVASLLVPKDRRKYVNAIYAFARTADDFADEPGYTPAERIEELNHWEMQLQECYRGEASHPVFVALRETVQRFDIPIELFQGLLHAFRSDVINHRYETFDDVLEYCRFSANPIGRLVLLLFNYRNESLMRLSDHICTGLQLANFWQDVSVDVLKDRLYIPIEDMRRYGVAEEEILAGKASIAFRDMMEMEVERTEEFFVRGEPLLNEVGRDLMMELKLTLAGGRAILKKIGDLDYDVLTKRPTLTLWNKVGLLVRSFLTQ
ncbi:MAG TPA: squalene synthase HpnC [Bacteroidota bacterium]|nr:squalene synthase HpnC [Bacteroidota bacterium]